MTTTEDATGTPPDRDEPAIARFVDDFAADLMHTGVPRMPARVLACLMASEDGVLTAAELSSRLGISAAAVSGAVKYLTQMRLISRGLEPSTRRDLYRVQPYVWHRALIGREQLLSDWQRTLRGGVEILGEDTDAGRRLAESAEFVRFVEEELDSLLDRWQARRAEQHNTDPTA